MLLLEAVTISTTAVWYKAKSPSMSPQRWLDFVLSVREDKRGLLRQKIFQLEFFLHIVPTRLAVNF